jgi:hypothetical protein
MLHQKEGVAIKMEEKEEAMVMVKEKQIVIQISNLILIPMKLRLMKKLRPNLLQNLPRTR